MSANTSTGQNERYTVNHDKFIIVIVNVTKVSETLPSRTSLNVTARNAYIQRVRDTLHKTAGGHAKAQTHRNTSSAMKHNHSPVATNSKAPRSLPTNVSTVTPTSTTQVKVIVVSVVSKILRQSVNAEASVYEDYDASV